MTEILDIGVPSGRTLTAGVGLAGGGTLAADRTFTVAIPQINGFRLTLTTAVPVTTADVTGATTIYLTPYKGGMIALYDGAAWALYSSAEISLALGTLTSGLPYDVFVLQTAGVLSMELLAWTNDTTRATAIAVTNGVPLKTGALTRRLVGTIYTTSTTATEDSAAKRYVASADNQVNKSMAGAVETIDSWSYSTDTWRQANANTANQLAYVCSVVQHSVEAEVFGLAFNSNVDAGYGSVGIGIDATNANSAQIVIGNRFGNDTGTYNSPQYHSKYVGNPGIGRHTLVWLERFSGSGTQSWRGDSGIPNNIQTGIVGEVFV